MKAKNYLQLIAAIAIPLAVGAISGYFTSQNIKGWYEGLQFPTFRPPNWLFGPVWTTLYILMGIGSFIIRRKPASEQRSNALLVYGVQLFVNGLWSFVFFYFKQIGIAVGVIIVLWLLIVSMINHFRKLNTAAAVMQVPYLLWVSFASVLNIAIWQLNT